MIQLPISENIDVLADWAEASCFFGHLKFISRSEIESALEESGIANTETKIGDIWGEINRRHFIASIAHPIVCKQEELERLGNWSYSPAYAFQLLLALRSYFPSMSISVSKFNKAAKMFEQITTHALSGYLEKCPVANIGSPRAGDIPRNFCKCLDYIAKELREKRGIIRQFQCSTKDENVDIVAWHPFKDGRPGQMIILTQCAAGKDWKTKMGEISLDVWRQYINWLVEPLKAFAFPFVCVQHEWDYRSRMGGILLDRLRISLMFATAEQDTSLLSELNKWNRFFIRCLPILS